MERVMNIREVVNKLATKRECLVIVASEVMPSSLPFEQDEIDIEMLGAGKYNVKLIKDVRFSRCAYGDEFWPTGRKHPAWRDSLPFADLKPELKYDSHYCGCWGFE